MAKKALDTLRFCTPASWWGEKWREGLFCGNGDVGADVFGGAVNERILLCKADLLWQGRINVVPDVSSKIRDVRRFVDVSDLMKAQSVIPDALTAKNFRPQPPCLLPVGEISLDFNVDGKISDFSRQLNMSTGEATVAFSDGATKIERRLFVSRESGCVVNEIKKQGAKTLNFDVSFGFVDEAKDARRPDGGKVVCDRQFLCFSAKCDDGTDFGAVVKVSAVGGLVKADGGVISIQGANSVLILTKVFANVNGDKAISELKAELLAQKDVYDKMLKQHVVKHQRLMSTTAVWSAEDQDKSIEDLLLEKDVSVELLGKLFSFGRYLLVSAYPEKGKDVCYAPTGLWNGSYEPYRAFCDNSEFVSAFSGAAGANVSFMVEDLFAYYESRIGDYRDNALRLFGCHGIFIPAVTAHPTGRLGLNEVFCDNFTGCAAMLSCFFYRYAVSCGSAAFLKRLVPFMKETALFYEDLFQMKNGVAEICPDVLPTRVFDSVKIKNRPVLGKNSALSFAVAKDFYTDYVAVLTALERSQKEIDAAKEMLAAIPEQTVGTDGLIKEFINSPISADYSGVSLGTLYPVAFSDEVGLFSDEEKRQLYLKVADKKLTAASEQNGMSMATLSAIYAKLGEANKACECLENVVNGCAMGNLAMVDKDWRGMGVCGNGTRSPMQLGINTALLSAICNMLVYCQGDNVRVLPCNNFSGDLCVQSLICSNGVEISYSLNRKAETLSVELKSKKSVSVSLYLPENVKRLLKTSGKNAAVFSKNCVSDVVLDANKPWTAVFKWQN